jgi:hypothetical protein
MRGRFAIRVLRYSLGGSVASKPTVSWHGAPGCEWRLDPVFAFENLG